MIKEERKKYNKKYHKKHREEHLLKYKEYRNINIEEIKKYKKDYYIKNKEEIKKKSLEYRNKHKKETNIYIKNRKAKDVRFHLRRVLRSRFYNAVKKEYKNTSVINLIGCDIKDLKQYLQSQFKQGMTWDNYGKWHIDHIKPCTSFDLSKREEQLKCFHYTNLQPLWAKENRIKGVKYNG